jgi:outer membrane protein OmpA-like peptidoglycan-associated protein
MRHRESQLIHTTSILLALLAGIPAGAGAQGWIEDAAKRAVKGEAARQVHRAVAGAIRCAVGEYECYEKARSDGKEVVFVDENGEVIEDADGNPVTDPSRLPPQPQQASTSATTPAPSSVNASYDFEPGERVLFYEDFTGDHLGDFPRRMELVRGNWDVVEVNGRRLLRNTGPRHSALRIPLPETLPERFTIELEVLLYRGNANLALAISPPAEGAEHQYRVAHTTSNYFDIGSWGVGVVSRDASDVTATQTVGDALTAAPVPVRIMADGRHVKMYVGEQRVANVPNGDLVRGDTLWLENTFAASQEDPIYVGSIRVAAGGRDLYDALAAEGRVAVHDILFDTDAATIRPESAEVLAEIATMLQEHPELSLMVEGHTDSTGDFDHNMDLSKQRADSVTQWLVESHGIAADRLRTMGLGSTQPKDTNDTDAGRQQNRRVELVRIG